MNINKIILNSIRNELLDYNCYEIEIDKFMESPHHFDVRQERAISIIDGIMTKHGKENLLRYVVELARVEHGIRELEPRVRDHVVHALLSFLLGIYINKNFLKPKGNAVDEFQWKLSGLFHDIGYPVQISKNILKPYTKKINEIKKELCVERPDIYFKFVPVGLEKLTNDLNSLDLIQEAIEKWGLDIDTHKEYNLMIESGNVCHGIISALSIVYVIDLMYNKYNPKREYKNICRPDGVSWDQTYFENDVVPSCSAIFVHNLHSRCFSKTPIEQSRAPLAFLLKLSDCLQDWERPSAEKPDGISGDNFKIKMSGSKLIFSVNQTEQKEKILEELESSLVLTNIDII